MSGNVSISSITAGPRQTNIECLRILAMFLVLTVHAAFWATGGPTIEDFNSNPLGSFTKTLIESISIVCVDVFILISGWFGIRPTAKGFCNFIFQCAYFLVGIYAVFLLFGWAQLSFEGIAGMLCLTKMNWFIKAYAALYIISPILNAFVEKADKKTFRNVLIAFFIFQTIWGWTNAAKFVAGGYSTFSFIGLYLLARYVHLYGIGKLSDWGGVSYVVCVILNTIAYYLCCRLHIPISVFAYVNPLVIIGSLGMLLHFVNLKVRYNKTINWIAKSSFAVFLLHTNPNIGVPVFVRYIKEIYTSISGIECMAVILAILIMIYIVAIILDQPRKWLWNKYIAKYFSR